MPSAISRHSSSGEETSSTSPGYRQAMATMATGSSGGGVPSRVPGRAPWAGGDGAPSSASYRNSATASGVGRSNTRVAGSSRPVSVPSRSRSSTPCREPSPSSVKAWPGSGSVPSPPHASAVASRTRLSRAWRCSGAGSARSRARSPAAASLRPVTRASANCPARTARWILPEEVRGTEAPNRISSGTLKADSRCRHLVRSRAGSTPSGPGTTNATGTSPRMSCGRPTTAASATPGQDSSSCSTSTGLTFCPPRMIRSLTRPVTHSPPPGSRRPRSPVRYQPSRRARSVLSGRLWYPIIRLGPRTQISPSSPSAAPSPDTGSATRTSTPGTGCGTRSAVGTSSRSTAILPQVSVAP